MMPKDYLKFLTLSCRKFAKQHNIFDIILYGSAVKGKQEPRDIDILVMFKDIKLKQRLDITQKLKSILKIKIKNIDIKTINFDELFDKTFLARQSILIEGYSLVNKKKFSELFGFKSYVHFAYNLKNLNHNDKTKFTYVLIGRVDKKISMINQTSAEVLGKGSVMIPIENSLIFQKFLDTWNVNYKKKNMLVS